MYKTNQNRNKEVNKSSVEMDKPGELLVTERRQALILGAGTMAVWHKPIVDAVFLPAHEQTSPVLTPAELCPMIVLGNVVTGPVSGSNTPLMCSITFDVVSAQWVSR